MLAFTARYEVNYFDYASPIPYSKWQTISFADFKGLDKPGETLNGVSEFAFIKMDRIITFLPENKVAITTYFYPSRSYVFNQNIRNNDLLRHELYHFHIAEYCSRLFRKELSETDNADASVVDQLKIKYTELEKSMQIEYDEESYHSYVLSEQKKWETTIDKDLASLANFSDPVISLKK